MEGQGVEVELQGVGRRGTVAGAVAGVLVLAGATAPVQAGPAVRPVAAVVSAPGLVQETWAVPGASAAVHVARRDAGSPVRLQLVQARDAIDRGPETTSAMCRRTEGCRLAVNGDFFAPAGAPRGAVVVGGRMLRSPRPDHEQLSLEPLRVTSPGLGDGGWSGEVQLPDDRPPLRLSGLNTDLGPGELVLYTSAFGASTPECTCVELRLAEQGVPAGTLGRPAPVTVTGGSRGGSPLPPGTAVVAGEGAAAQALQELLAVPVPLVLWVTTTAPTVENVGVHPVLMRGGKPTAYDAADPMLARPHPRTLVGWDARGTLWLVAAEGRRAGSPGLTAAQAVQLLQELGATEAVMLDGGGSTSFVAAGRLVSEPSDGAERPVANALVLTWANKAPAPVMAVRAAAPPASPAAIVAAPAAQPVAAPPPAAAAPAPVAPPVEPAAAEVAVVEAAPPSEEAPPRTRAPRRLPPAGEAVPRPARAAAAPIAAPTDGASPGLAHLVAVGLLSAAVAGCRHAVVSVPSSRASGPPARAAAPRCRLDGRSR